MKHFQFYKAPNLDAKVGIGMVRGRFVLYFPAKGMSKRKSGNVARNPDRLALYHYMADQCLDSRLSNSLRVVFYKAGKAINGAQMTYEHAGPSKGAEFSRLHPKDIQGRGNYAYTLGFKRLPKQWGHADKSPEDQCNALAAILGLEPTINARKVAIS